jgi:hypothetical protein
VSDCLRPREGRHVFSSVAICLSHDGCHMETGLKSAIFDLLPLAPNCVQGFFT